MSRRLDGAVVSRPEEFQDERGFPLKTLRKDLFAELGFPGEFVQDNYSISERAFSSKTPGLT